MNTSTQGAVGYKRKGNALGFKVTKKAKKAPTAMDKASTALTKVNALKRSIKQELKPIVFTGASTVINSSGTAFVSRLTQIAQGTDDNERIGEYLTVKKITLRYRANWNTSSANTQLRFVIAAWDDLETGTPPSSDYFEGGTVLGSAPPIGNEKIWKKFYDVLIPLDYAHRTYVAEETFFMNHKVQFNGVNAVDARRGGIYLMLISNEPANGPNVSWNAKVEYTDS